MARIRGTTLIARPVEEVFDAVADERNEPTYNPRMTSVDKLTPGPIGVGTRWRTTLLAGGRPVVATLSVTEYEPPRRLGCTTTMDRADISGGLTLEPHPAGTRLSWSWEVRPRGLMRLASPLVAVVGRRREAAIWATLKHQLESGP